MKSLQTQAPRETIPLGYIVSLLHLIRRCRQTFSTQPLETCRRYLVVDLLLLVGERFGKAIEKLSLDIYKVAAERTEGAGIILADTKFEFGVDGEENVVLVDEVLTPDSSRFWVRSAWERNLGKRQPSFDKQFLRDWLLKSGLDGKDRVTVPEDVVLKTAAIYREACEKTVG